VHPKRAAPTTAIVLVWFISCVVVLSLEWLEFITSVSAVATYLGYAGILLAAMRGLSGVKNEAGFHLGKWRPVVGGIALVWVLCLIGALTVPAAGRLPAELMGAVLAVSALIYFFLIPSRINCGQAGPPTEHGLTTLNH
jgi:hypothetical protein